ncbi:cell division ATP-binding protein FtsE [Candidiatus Paracoxiella cheracis]|uniref:cell division ATP-binding protein FtsE n=1 Tax=Candidiatus Paracoxiella cheracis TaxID=3405120 RepID=UPI003BF4BD50
MIRFANVSKNYPNGHQALSDVSFSLDRGEMVFLTGHSGAGKTTLLKLIMMIEPLTQGQIFINNRNLTRLSTRHIPYLRRHVGMIFQNPQLLHHRSIFDNVAIPLVITGYHQKEIKRRVRAALDKVGLLKKERLFPASLSSGAQQRVGIARAIVNKPMIVLADEPTGNLDPELSFEIMRLFEAFNNVGVTVVVATHDLSLIAPLNHRIMTLKAGQLVGDQGNEH